MRERSAEVPVSDSKSEGSLVHRLEQTRREIRRAEACYGLCWIALAAACCLGASASADYVFELSWRVRAMLLAGTGVLVAIVAIKQIVEPLLWWSRPRTAVEIEQRFPQLGQRVRTLVQFSGHSDAQCTEQGVAPDLVTALESEADARAAPLDLGVLVPRRKLAAAALAAAVPILLLVIWAASDWEFRLAVSRALLNNRPYTKLAVAPGDCCVDAGTDAALSVELQGRTNRHLVLYWRAAGEAGATQETWTRRDLPPAEAESRGPRRIQYETLLAAVDRPTEYWVSAGPAQSEVYRIDVRYPPSIESFQVRLTPPAYTQQPPSLVEGGDLEVIEGTEAELQIELDRPCARAEMIVTPSPYAAADQPQPAPRTISMQVGGKHLSATGRFDEDASYSLTVTATDGLHLPENRYRVRVRKDQPPEIVFERPDEALEVHPIAEVPMRVRGDDDFGLTRMGVVFQVNDGEEQTLVEKDFEQAGSEADMSKAITQALLEETLMLEGLGLSPTQAVTYYAFAEDNYPGGPRRAMTDLRFIDIREFKRLYKVGGT